MLTSCLNIIFLYLHVFWKNQIFISKIQVWENTDFGLRQNYNITKMVQIIYNMCWIFVTHICISKILKELIFVKFLWFYGPLSGGGRSSRRSTVGFGPVDRAVDRRHNGQKYDRWPVDRPVDRKGNLGFSRLQRAEFLWSINTHFFELF